MSDTTENHETAIELEQVTIKADAHTLTGAVYPGHDPRAKILPGYVMAMLTESDGPYRASQTVTCRDDGETDADGRRVLRRVEPCEAADFTDEPRVTPGPLNYHKIDVEGAGVLTLDLDRVKTPVEQVLVCRAILKRDAGEFLFSSGDSVYMLGLVRDNATALKKLGMLEASIVGGWTAAKGTNAGFNAIEIARILDGCDRDKLQEVTGQPMPDGDRFTLYRGVAGTGKWRRIRGLAWTDSLDIACWFASRFAHLGDPAIMTASVPKSGVYFYTDERSEREYVTHPKRYKRMDIAPEDVADRAKAWADKMRARQKAEMEAFIERNKKTGGSQ